MKSLVRLVAATSLAALLTGCAYKPLKAPCSPDEGGTPLAYSDVPPPLNPQPFQHLNSCGPMKPI